MCAWVYTRAGMPVEITAEFENWRRIRDWEGAEGWVYHSLLSGKRSAVVVPNLKGDWYRSMSSRTRTSRRLPDPQGVLGTSRPVTAAGANSPAKNFDGWIGQDRLWGAYPSEKVE